MDPIEHVVNFLKDVDELDAANNLLDVFGKYAVNIQHYDILAKLYHDIKNYKQAVVYAEKVLAIANSSDQLYAARANLAKLYNHINKPEKALTYLDINAIYTTEYDPEILLEKVFSLFLLNRKDESEQILRTMLANQHMYDERVLDRVKFNIGTYDLYKGNFQDGLRGFLLNGKKLGIWRDIKLDNTKFWSGEHVPGRDIIIFAEGGIGDELINIRFTKKIKDLGMNPIWYTSRKDVAEIFNINGYYTITELSDVNLDNYLWTYSMSLPIYLNVSMDELWDGPYLKPIELDTLPTLLSGNLKVGIRWTGNPRYEQDLHRSVPLELLYNSIKKSVNDATIYSLQRDDGVEQLDTFTHDIIDLSKHLTTWKDTLNIINQLDIVITSCTSVAHAAAAMGKRTFIIVPITAYYTWACTNDTTTVWYGDSTTILRQTVIRSWHEPLAQLHEFLNK